MTFTGDKEERRLKRQLSRLSSPRHERSMRKHRFIGVDGEGWTDSSGQHHYMTFTVGDKTLYTGKPLRMVEIFEFLSDFPVEKNLYYVSYFFDYDVTMILRELGQTLPEYAAQLFSGYNYKWWRTKNASYAIRYIPKMRFAVKKYTPDNSKKSIMIHDLQKFFQSSFLVALEKYQIGTEKERRLIESMKQQRSDFSPSQVKSIIKYSEMETRLLARLAEKLRDNCAVVKINPSPYEGPGYLARNVLRHRFGIATHKLMMEKTPEKIKSLAKKAYYGGRFETLAHGKIPQKVYEYDITSAYPAAMLELPCLACGKWTPGIKSDLYIAKIRWQAKTNTKMIGGAMPFPVRGKTGIVSFPTKGEGWYWSHEIELGKKICDIEVLGDAYSFIKQCEHKPFHWIPEIFNERKALDKKQPNSGIAHKLTLNALYGVQAQNYPTEGKFYNAVYASLITSITRARVYDIYTRKIPVVMFATDAVFTLEKLPHELLSHKGLGGWELANDGIAYSDLTIFQPGVYFNRGVAKFKTRGIPKKIFISHAKNLESAALKFDKALPVDIDIHLSLRLGLHRGTPQAIDNIGNWMSITKHLSANPVNKRVPKIYTRKNINWSKPYNDKLYKTVPWTTKIKVIEDIEQREDDFISDGFYEGDIIGA